MLLCWLLVMLTESVAVSFLALGRADLVESRFAPEEFLEMEDQTEDGEALECEDGGD